ncbi:glycosyltransferase [Nitratidesulfovibrio liaohensis]|uniref:Glycosyltransferase n=1 Tax=Nitratidesulfovibrio liaohensis TaxID=2604158 RepID=A0ABY9R3P7_9BACT|nr:glycosyltransferase [Nitratidesulfovibrio liaohensis]WMW66079.1 glycosyltransferase [Nitratidesulfovibrio liaohensis]
MTTTLPAALHFHTLLSHRGGATRVAHMLARGLARRGVVVHRTCEILDGDISDADSPNGGVAGSADGYADGGAVHGVVPAAGVGGCLMPGMPLHLHATLDWTACLGSIVRAGQPEQLGLSGQSGISGAAGQSAPSLSIVTPVPPVPPVPLIITVHDCSLLTGGCVYPIDCDGWRTGCPGTCPRGYPGAAPLQDRRASALRSAAPLLVSPSGWLARMVRARFPDLPCSVVPNGVESAGGPTQAEARAALGIATDARVAIFVAHGGEQAMLKGGHRWMALWSEVKRAVPAAVGLMVGGDAAGRDGDLLRWPYVDRVMLDTLLAASDVFVYPTLADNHALVVLEAMAAGVPVCSFRVGGLPEQVEEGVTGALADEGDWGGLAASVVGLLERPRLARTLGRAGQDVWRTRFTVDRMVEDYLKVYARL